MTRKEKDKQIATALRELADKIDPPVYQRRQPPRPETREEAQEAHESALASFNTQQKGGMRQSLNSAAIKAEIEAFLKDMQKKDD